MIPNLHPKCANPSCAVNFEWLAGGRLFRFNRNPESHAESVATGALAAQSHRVKHFWLCERCSGIYTLTYEPDQGVSIRALWPMLPAAKEKMELPAFSGVAAAKTT